MRDRRRAQKAKGIGNRYYRGFRWSSVWALVRQVLADTTGPVIAASTSPEPVPAPVRPCWGQASGAYPDLAAAMHAMSELGAMNRPGRRARQMARQTFEFSRCCRRSVRGKDRLFQR